MRKALLAAGVVLAALGVLVQRVAISADYPVRIPSPAVDSARAKGALQKAVLAGGCFWGVQGVFEHLVGVKRVLSGYSGGESGTAQYETVSEGTTGHAESVEVLYDPAEVSYGDILRVFFSVAHDPTELNRQGPDTGTQYRSAIFYANADQQRIAAAYIAQLNAAKVFRAPIVTRVDPLRGFYAAEGYHQDFLLNHPDHLYIVINDLPKVRNFSRTLPELYRSQPVKVGGAAGQ